ncbi:MAG: YdcF family protein [Anaerolineae bacterium]|nr:YdcF family protein [Anaerolineae bacterium]
MAKRIKRLVFLLCVLATAVITGIALDVYRFSLRDETRPADAAIVLGAAVFGDQPSPVFQERINHAIHLYQNGIVRTIIFTGGHDGDGRLPEAIVARAYAIAHGVPESAILIETESQITWQNLQNARSVAEAQGITSFLIVSDPLHMKRAMLMATDLGIEAASSPTPTTRYQTLHTQAGFLAREVWFLGQHLLYRPIYFRVNRQ